MTPIDLTLRVGRLPAASTPVGGELSAEQVDGNFTALKTAAEQLNAEKLSADAATPVTLRATELLGTDDFMLLRGGVPYLVAPTVMATYFGSAPAATAPAALTAGQWTATAGTTSVVINITALPSDGGSAITALEYRIGTGAAVALTGTGTGSRTISGLTADVAIDLQVRAVNAVGAGDWSDTKTATPTAAVGGGGVAAWESVSLTAAQANNFDPIAPAGLVASDLQVAVVYGARLGDVAPAGWTLASEIFTDFASGIGVAVWTAPGSTAQGSWVTAQFALVDIHRVSGAVGVRGVASQTQLTWPTGASGSNMPSPSVLASAGDAVMSIYYGPQNGPTPTAPTTDYTRVVSRIDPNAQSVLARSNVPAGATGDIQHGYGQAWEARAAITVVLAAS